MKKIICKKEYDTETATIVKKVTFGNFGEADGYEETLCQTPDGLFFLYVNGGAESAHPAEDITRMSKAKAEAWLKDHE
jgi:hypothetical protein